MWGENDVTCMDDMVPERRLGTFCHKKLRRLTSDMCNFVCVACCCSVFVYNGCVVWYDVGLLLIPRIFKRRIQSIGVMDLCV